MYVANVTPFKEGSLAVDTEAYLSHVSWLAQMGVRGVVPFGANGEGPSVTLGEKVRVLEALFQRGLGIQIIPAVMQNNLPETLEMLRLLEDYPATAVLILPPYYFKPVEPKGCCASTSWRSGRQAMLPSSTISPSTPPRSRAGRKRASGVGR